MSGWTDATKAENGVPLTKIWWIVKFCSSNLLNWSSITKLNVPWNRLKEKVAYNSLASREDGWAFSHPVTPFFDSVPNMRCWRCGQNEGRGQSPLWRLSSWRPIPVFTRPAARRGRVTRLDALCTPSLYISFLCSLWFECISLQGVLGSVFLHSLKYALSYFEHNVWIGTFCGSFYLWIEKLSKIVSDTTIAR